MILVGLSTRRTCQAVLHHRWLCSGSKSRRKNAKALREYTYMTISINAATQSRDFPFLVTDYSAFNADVNTNEIGPEERAEADRCQR
jgi:hypothetical protein